MHQCSSSSMCVGPAAHGSAPRPASPLVGAPAAGPPPRARLRVRVAVSGGSRRGPSRSEWSDSTGAPHIRREAVARTPSLSSLLDLIHP